MALQDIRTAGQRVAIRDRFYGLYRDFPGYLQALDKSLKLASGYLYGIYDFDEWELARYYNRFVFTDEAARDILSASVR